MARITINLHESVLRKTRKLAHDQHTTLGEAITELLNIGLAQKTSALQHNKKPFSLPSFNMGVPLISLEDKEALMLVGQRPVTGKATVYNFASFLKVQRLAPVDASSSLEDIAGLFEGPADLSSKHDEVYDR